jgi:hypothetical protein
MLLTEQTANYHNVYYDYGLTSFEGCAIVQAVSRQLPAAAARFRAQDRLCGICGEQSGTGTGFLRVLRFALSILIPPTAHLSPGAGTIGQLVADVLSGLSPTPPQETKKKKTTSFEWYVNEWYLIKMSHC